MKHLVPFSKEMIDDTVTDNDEGQRSGFTDHVHIHKCETREPRKGLADFQKQDPPLAGNSSYPEFEARSDDGLPEFPKPFSKTKIAGGPKKPYTPA